MLIFVAGFFLIANRAAYRGFLSDDDFENIANARQAGLSFYAEKLIEPAISGDVIFRPAADLYYWVLSRAAGLNYGRYVAAIHLIHLINVCLVWLLARSLGAPPLGASAAALFFSFQMAVFDVYWQPRFVFDALCGTFTLLALIAYVEGRLIFSLVFFWLAVKSKELAILLPLALAGYELWIGKQRWRRLTPFFAISAIFGIQALAINTHRENLYSLRFGLGNVWSCARFYASQLVLAPGAWGLAGFAALALPFLFRNRLVRFGVLTFVVMLGVMLVLPGRLLGAYLYVPLIGLAIAMASATRPVWLAVFFAIWIPWNYRQLRIDRRAELAEAADRRAWFLPIEEFARAHPGVETFVYRGQPDSFNDFGVPAAIRCARPPDSPYTVVEADSPEAAAVLARPKLALLIWNGDSHLMQVIPRTADVPYIRLNDATPLWQLTSGWIDTGPSFRWIAPHATARLARPAGAKWLEIMLYVPQVYLDGAHRGRLDISLDGRPIGSAALDKAAPLTVRLALPAGGDSTAKIEFDVSPPLHDPSGSGKIFGIPIAAFGFVQ